MPPTTKNYLRPEVLAKIGDLELRARLVVEGFVSGMHRSPYHGQSVEFAQHREYVPGDDLRHLDWRVYGKSDRFYIKQYEEETNLQAHLLLDCSSSMRYPDHGGKEPPAGAPAPQPAGDTARQQRLTKFEYAATVAASLAYLLLHQRDAVGLMLFDSEIRAELPPLSNQAHLRPLIRRIEQARLDQPTQTQGFYAGLAGRLRRRGMVLLISDLLDDPGTVVSGLQRLRYANHEVVVMHVLDHDEREFPFRDNTLFEGLEAPDVQVLADPQSLRSSYLASLEAFIAHLRGACMNSGIDYVELSTTDPLDIALRSYLAARTRLSKTRA